MVDVGAKAETRRTATAVCHVHMSDEARRAVAEGTASKGDVLAVAQVAGVQAAKRTPELIPGCHPLRISGVDITFAATDEGYTVTARVKGTDRTGFEMEALTAASVAALTVYDMCKAIDPDMTIDGLRVTDKTGGTSVRAVRLDGTRAAVLTVSDRSAAGERADGSGPAARAWLEARGASVIETRVVRDDRGEIAAALRDLAAAAQLVVTSGGTGVSPTDVTPEATLDVADRVVPGLAEQIRAESLRVTPNALISRGAAVVVGDALVVNLPGSPKAVGEALDAIAAVLPHALTLLRGEQPHA